jgi:hypothetical protein
LAIINHILPLVRGSIMTIHQNHYEFSGITLPERHSALNLSPSNLARRFILFTPSGPTIKALVSLGEQAIGGVAHPDVVRRVVSQNPDSLWAIARKSRFDAANPVAEGFFAFLMLNEAGLAELAADRFDATNPIQRTLPGKASAPPPSTPGLCAHRAGLPLRFRL